jgi:hypothetical protein
VHPEDPATEAPAKRDGPAQPHSASPAVPATGVVITALGLDGEALRRLQVELLDRTSLTVLIPEGTRTLRLEGTTGKTPRYRVELGPVRRIVGPPTRWWWRRRR